MVGPGQEGWQAAVEAIDAGEDINYEGAAGSVDLDENGDVSKGAILIWQIQGEAIEDTDERAVDLSCPRSGRDAGLLSPSPQAERRQRLCRSRSVTPTDRLRCPSESIRARPGAPAGRGELSDDKRGLVREMTTAAIREQPAPTAAIQQDAILEVRSVTKAFGGNRAVDDCSFNVSPRNDHRADRPERSGEIDTPQRHRRCAASHVRLDSARRASQLTGCDQMSCCGAESRAPSRFHARSRR